jgi:glycosylphosphatidylinositol transamidase (GPIT) subunit GPI8
MRLVCMLVAFIAVAAGWLRFVAAESPGHSNNWAVLVDTSRYWFNYRHIANTLSIYTTVKR